MPFLLLPWYMLTNVCIDYISTMLTFIIFAIVAGFFNVYFAKSLSVLIPNIRPIQPTIQQEQKRQDKFQNIQQRHIRNSDEIKIEIIIFLICDIF